MPCPPIDNTEQKHQEVASQTRQHRKKAIQEKKALIDSLLEKREELVNVQNVRNKIVLISGKSAPIHPPPSFIFHTYFILSQHSNPHKESKKNVLLKTIFRQIFQ